MIRLRRFLGQASATKKLAIRGTLWTVVGFGSSQILRLAANLVITRLLYPELFGLMSLATTVMMALSLFSDVGLSASVIRRKEDLDERFLNTVWTAQLFRGAVLWAFAILAAYPVARFYGEPRVLWLLPMVGFSAVLLGLTSTSVLRLERDMDVRSIALLDLSTQLISTAVMIAVAWIYPSIWALVGGTMVSTFARVFWSFRLNSGHTTKLCLDGTAIKEILALGKWISVVSALTFLSVQADRFVVGKLVSIEFLGVYTVAVTLAEVPRVLMSIVASRVMFPAFARLVDLPRDILRQRLVFNREAVLLAAAVVLGAEVAFGDIAIKVLYDQRYHAAGWVLPLLAAGLWPVLLGQVSNSLLLALGRPKAIALSSFVSLAVLLIGASIGSMWAGAFGAVVGIAMKDVLSYFVVQVALHRERLSFVKEDILISIAFVTICFTLVGVRMAVGLGQPAFLFFWPT